LTLGSLDHVARNVGVALIGQRFELVVNVRVSGAVQAGRTDIAKLLEGFEMIDKVAQTVAALTCIHPERRPKS